MKRLIENNGRIIFFAVAMLSIFSAYVAAGMSRDLINATEFVKNGVTGKGVKVAVIDYGFLNYDVEQKNGGLPTNLQTIDLTKTPPTPLDPRGSSVPGYEGHEHGMECVKIIYDIAPEAELYLINVGPDSKASDFKKARDYCISKDIRIVNISLQFRKAESFDIVKEVDQFSDNNILAVTIAGNWNDDRWFGNLKDNSSVNPYLLFPSGKEYLEIAISNTNFDFFINICDICDKNTIDHNKYFFELHNAKTYPLALWSNDLYGGIEITTEWWFIGSHFLSFAPVAGEIIRLKIRNDGAYHGDIGLMLDFIKGTRLLNNIDKSTKSSLASPGDARNSLTVGGIHPDDYNKGDTISPCSGRGPVQAVKDSSGRVLIPEVLKPEIVAPGGVTSYAAPRVTGAAALLASLKPELLNNAGEFKNYIISNHVKRIHSSPDNTYGYGKLFLDSSIVPITAGDVGDVGDVGDGDLNLVSYPCPNPVSIKNQGYIKIPNLPLNISYLNIEVYSVTGEFVKSFNSDDVEHDSILNRNFIKWDLKNQNGNKVAPGVYFLNMKINDNKQIKKIAVQK